MLVLRPNTGGPPWFAGSFYLSDIQNIMHSIMPHAIYHIGTLIIYIHQTMCAGYLGARPSGEALSFFRVNLNPGASNMSLYLYFGADLKYTNRTYFGLCGTPEKTWNIRTLVGALL